MAEDVMALVRADRWPEAQAAAARIADPIATKLVTWFRLMAPLSATVSEIAAFQQDSPDWPLQLSLGRRRDEALALELDDSVVLAECARLPPLLPGAMIRCAQALAAAGRAEESAALVRRAWITGPPDAAIEARFMREWGSVITGDDQRERFARLAWTDTPAAARQAARLDPADQPLAQARLALRRDEPSAPALVSALPASSQFDPGLVLDQARYLRRADQDDAAAALWQAQGADAERAAPSDRQADFWNERNLMARRRLRQGDAAGAYAIAAGHGLRGVEQVADADFLAGFIALRRLNQPVLAATHFRHLAEISGAAITQGRAHYWLARAAAAQGDTATAAVEYGRAAAWPSTFYGQLAALAEGGTESLAARLATPDPSAGPQRALDLAGRELARAAAYLVAWGEPRRALPFLLRLDDVAPDAPDRTLAARLSEGFGLPMAGIGIARRAGRDGLMLLQTGWPVAASIPDDDGLDPALALAVIRQESSFDTATTSPVGARGLMQLMPATAATLAKHLGMAATPVALTADPSLNIRLGTAYLRDLLARFDGSVPLAVAAYNAGPARVAEWLSTYGDPTGSNVDVIDWIEMIPFSETRNYVQRVVENLVIYRAKRHEKLVHPLARWLR
jgi:soluble lytic murein transglycosylase